MVKHDPACHKPPVSVLPIFAKVQEVYAIERMGFGLSVAPKFLDAVMKWVLRDFEGVDNYLDDIRVPNAMVADVLAELSKHGLATEQADPFLKAGALGLLLEEHDGTAHWRRRDASDLSLSDTPTKWEVFRSTGQAPSHYPVCGWLGPVCSYVKRIATWSSGSEQKRKWDDAVSEAVCRLCNEFKEKLLKEDAAKGVQSIPSTQQWKVRCDTTDHALGVMLGTEVHVVEDAICLRSAYDRQHINVVELKSVIKAISLAAA